ncbi:response regulator [Spirosoma soli]|uniref:Response regulator n=1 Tax=Spirosoma soli TaxID=1770529 RepID=A0ABW5MBA8_9BACT
MKPLPKSTDSPPSLQPVSALVVEDNTDQWQFIEFAFKHNSIPITPILATNAKQALRFLERCALTGTNFPRFILLDLYLPKREHGLAFLTELRNKPEPLGLLPVVMLTASDQYEDMAASFEGGINGYIIKPLNPSDWLDCMVDLKQYWSPT